jgi:hypothetical protein
MGSLPTFAALANQISVKPEGERRPCGTKQAFAAVSQMAAFGACAKNGFLIAAV